VDSSLTWTHAPKLARDTLTRRYATIADAVNMSLPLHRHSRTRKDQIICHLVAMFAKLNIPYTHKMIISFCVIIQTVVDKSLTQTHALELARSTLT